MHPGQLDVTVETATALVGEQFPQWRGLVIRPVRSHGTVNLFFRLGDDLVLRFPLEPGEPDQKRAWLEDEAEAARRLLGRLPVPSPQPVALGEPGHGYPLPWVVYRWLPGSVAGEAGVANSAGFACDLACVVRALRSVGTGGQTFTGDGRGGLLTSQDRYVAAYLDDAAGMIDTPGLRELWSRLRATPRAAPDVWTHGDLMPAWNLLELGPRAVFRDAVGSDRDEWDRGKGWAFAQAIGCLAYYRVTNPPMSETARRTLQAAGRRGAWP